MGGGYLRFRSQFVDQFPIKAASTDEQNEFATLVNAILQINITLPGLEVRFNNFAEFTREVEVESVALGASPLPVDCSEIRDLIGKPKVRVDRGKVYVDNKSYFSVGHPDVGRYLSLYLSSLLKGESGMRKSDLLTKVLIPKTLEDVFTILSKHHALGNEIEAMKLERDGLDRHIDNKVYTLYGLTEEEMRVCYN
jgi:hypothetical protein